MNGGSWIRVGAVLGFLAVAVGAFGAHALKDRLESLGTSATFNTAVQYHFYHALALLALGVMVGPFRAKPASTIAAWAFLIGVGVFSGSLYALAVTGIKKLGIITPFGGLAFLVGWAALAVAASTTDGVPGTDRVGESTSITFGSDDTSRDVVKTAEERIRKDMETFRLEKK